MQGRRGEKPVEGCRFIWALGHQRSAISQTAIPEEHVGSPVVLEEPKARCAERMPSLVIRRIGLSAISFQLVRGRNPRAGAEEMGGMGAGGTRAARCAVHAELPARSH